MAYVLECACGDIGEPPYPVVHSSNLTTDQLDQLQCGAVAAVCITGVLEDDEARSLVSSIDRDKLSTYDADVVDPPIYKFGPTIFDHYSYAAPLSSYIPEAAAAEVAYEADFHTIAEVRSNLMWTLAGSLATAATLLRLDQARAFAGLIRSMPGGAGLHYDDLQTECAALAPYVPGPQFAFNLYLSQPGDPLDGEGALQLFRRPFDDSRVKSESGSYWKDPVSVEGAASVTIVPECGDLIVFAPRYVHRVLPSSGDRFTISSFFSIDPAADLTHFWS